MSKPHCPAPTTATPPALARRRFMKQASLLIAGASTGQLSCAATAGGRIEARLAELGIELPPAPAPVANYVAYQVAGNMAYLAGQIPMRNGELMTPGKVPSQVSVEQARAAARQCAINLISALKAACGGDLDRVQQCMRLQGFVASDDSFTQQPAIINGASDLMVEVFGDAGRHTRLAVGVNTLPLDSCVEVSGIFAIAS